MKSIKNEELVDSRLVTDFPTLENIQLKIKQLAYENEQLKLKNQQLKQRNLELTQIIAEL
jgi:regulator of replication initiation timing